MTESAAKRDPTAWTNDTPQPPDERGWSWAAVVSALLDLAGAIVVRVRT